MFKNREIQNRAVARISSSCSEYNDVWITGFQLSRHVFEVTSTEAKDSTGLQLLIMYFATVEANKQKRQFNVL